MLFKYLLFPSLTRHPLTAAPSLRSSSSSCCFCCSPVPGFVDQNIYTDDVGSGWGWRTYGAKNTRLMAKGEGLLGSNATCASLSKDGAIPFICRECTRPGYQPFAKATTIQFWIRSNTKSADPYASSTPPGKVPELKMFLMNVSCCLLWFWCVYYLPSCRFLRRSCWICT
jgi:hypothetical protein